MKKHEGHIERFTRIESALDNRYRALGYKPSKPARLTSWQTLIGDSEMYLHEYRTFIQDAESAVR